MKEPRRFWSKVEVGEPNECWEWQACKTEGGRGQFSVHGKLWYAYRVAWVLTYGPIPEGLCVCHHCDNPSCCNPYHLFVGTQSDNIRDAFCKGRGSTQRLSVENVLEIRELRATGEWSLQDLADAFDVSFWTITSLLRGRTWKDL